MRRRATRTEESLLAAGVIPAGWSVREARDWLWLHGIMYRHICREGTRRATARLKAHARWTDELLVSERPSSYRDGGILVAPMDRPQVPATSSRLKFGPQRELTGDEVSRKAADKVRGIVRAFNSARVTATDLDAMGAVPSPFKGIPRLYPCGRLWRPTRAMEPRELPLPRRVFRTSPTIDTRMLSSACGRFLQWIAMNPCSTVKEIAEACGRPYSQLKKELDRLKSRGLVVKVGLYAICPSLIGEDRLFNYR